MAGIQHDTGSLAADLGRLLLSGEGTDLTLLVGGSRLLVHSLILAVRSPVFAAMLRHETLESSSRHVNISDMEVEVTRQMLLFMYTDEAPLLPRLAPELLAASDKYDLPLLRERCEQQLALDLSVENAAATVMLAIQHSCSKLKEHAVDFIKTHLVEVMGTEGWVKGLGNHPQMVAEVSSLVAVLSSQAPSERRSLYADEKGWRLLQAAKDGTVGELRALLAMGADVGVRDGKRETALHWAAYSGDEEAVWWLLLAGAEVDARDMLQETPLLWAAWCGHTAVVELLVAAGADANVKRQDGWTPLLFAAWYGHAEMATALLEAGANKAVRDRRGWTPIDYARGNNKQQLVDILR